jgi:hypothetical protein
MDQSPAGVHLPEQAFQSGQLDLQFPDGAVPFPEELRVLR